MGQQPSPVQLGSQLAGQANQKYGTKESINTNLVIPLTSDTPMQTLDGSKSFSARLVCSGQSEILRVFIQPGGTGDLQSVIISQDLNFDGNFDYSYQLPVRVSGICTNGFISCDAGTWTNCRSYKWVSNAEGKVSAAETIITNLGGCYCINSSCGSNLVWNNLGIVLKTLGGGIVSALQTGNMRYVVSDIKIDGSLAKYYGQDTRNCSSIGGDVNEYRNYYQNPSALTGAVETTVSAQRSDPNSLYNLMFNVYQKMPSDDIKNCSIINSYIVKLNNNGDCVTEEYHQDTCSALREDPECKLRDEKIDGVTIFNNFVATGLRPIGECRTLEQVYNASCSYSCPAGVALPCTGDPPTCSDGNSTYNCQAIQPITSYGGSLTFRPICNIPYQYNGIDYYYEAIVKVIGQGNRLLFSYCDGSGIFGQIEYLPGIEVWGQAFLKWDGNNITSTGPGIDETGKQYTSALVFSPNLAFPVIGGKIYFKGISVNANGNCPADLMTVTVSNNSNWDFSGCVVCTGYGCGYGSGSATFIPNVCPLPGGSECRGNPSYCDKLCVARVCPTFWKSERTYVCKNTNPDFNNITERVKSIKRSSSLSGGNLYYRDYIDGSYIDKNISLMNSYIPSSSSTCVMACKTKKVFQNTEANIVTTRANYQSDISSYEYGYKTCVDNVCPLEEGETIVKNCQCISDFSEALLIMQTLRLGGSDTICSSGQMRSLR